MWLLISPPPKEPKCLDVQRLMWRACWISSIYVYVPIVQDQGKQKKLMSLTSYYISCFGFLLKLELGSFSFTQQYNPYFLCGFGYLIFISNQILIWDELLPWCCYFTVKVVLSFRSYQEMTCYRALLESFKSFTIWTSFLLTSDSALPKAM